MRLIDADLFIKRMRDYCYVNDVTKKIIDTLSYITNVEAEFHSVDAVPVIRCKDCKFYQLENGIDEYECTNSEGIMWTVTGGDYCSRGEKE